jgi:hypothetical protein
MLGDYPAETLQDLGNGLVKFSLAGVTAKHVRENGFKFLIYDCQNGIRFLFERSGARHHQRQKFALISNDREHPSSQNERRPVCASAIGCRVIQPNRRVVK